MHDEALVEANKYNSRIKLLPVIARIETNYPILVRVSVAKKLARIAKNLPEDLYLQIDSGYRTQRSQQAIWSYRSKDIKTKDLVFNPQKGIPPHTTGGAVDVSLTDKNGVEINLSEPFQKYYEEPKLMSDKISEKAQKLRLLLNKLMLAEGFLPNPREYWHYSYGDYAVIQAPNELIYPIWLRTIFRCQRIGLRILRKLFNFKTNY